MSVAVLLVNYRAYDALDRALQSLGPYLDADDEVVVVDYVSDPSRVSDLARAHPRARLPVRDDNLGFAKGVNLAAAASRAPYLLWLNPDAVIEGPVPRVLERWLQTHDRVGVAAPRIFNADGTVQPTARRFPGLTTTLGGRSTWLTRHLPNNWFSRLNLIGRDATAPIEVDWVSGACLLTRRDLFERLGGLDESFFMYWEDADYCRRAGEAGFRSAYLPEVSARHIGGVSAQQDPIPAIRAFHRSAFHLYSKYASPLARVVAPFVRAGLWLRGELRVRQERRKAARRRGAEAQGRS